MIKELNFLIVLIYTISFICMLIVSYLLRKQKNSLAAAYTFFSGIILLFLIILLRLDVMLIESNSLVYQIMILLILLVWVYIYLLNLLSRVQKLLVDSSYPELITVILLGRLNRFGFLHKIFYVKTKPLFFFILFVCVLVFFENYFFDKIYVWCIFITSYVLFLNFRANCNYLIKSFNSKYNNNLEDDYLIVDVNLYKIYNTGVWNSLWETISSAYNFTPGASQTKMPKGVFAPGTPPSIIIGTCLVVGTISCGVIGKSYFDYHKQFQRTIQEQETSWQIQQQVAAQEELRKTEEAKLAVERAKLVTEEARLASYKAEQVSLDKAIRLEELKMKNSNSK